MWLSDFTLVLPDRLQARGAIRIEDGRIVEIADHPVSGGVAGDGLALMPGFIDMHGDMIESELEPRPGVAFPMEVALQQLDARLAASGVTTAYAAVSFSRGAQRGARRSFEHTSQIIRALHSARHRLRIDHRIHARFEITYDTAVEVLAGLVRAGQVDLVSLMDHTPGQGQYRDIERHIQQLAQSQSLSETEARQIVSTQITGGARPENRGLATLRAVARLCHDQGVILASHDDDTAQKVDLMADLGVKIAEFPVTEEAAEAAAARGLVCAMGAPNALRGQSSSGNLSARDCHARGLLGILAADYHPGAILPAMQILAETDPGGLSGAVALATATPARALGLTDRGALRPGLRADLAIADLTGAGRVLATLSGGAVAYSNGGIRFAAARAAMDFAV